MIQSGAIDIIAQHCDTGGSVSDIIEATNTAVKAGFKPTETT